MSLGMKKVISYFDNQMAWIYILLRLIAYSDSVVLKEVFGEETVQHEFKRQ